MRRRPARFPEDGAKSKYTNFLYKHFTKDVNNKIAVSVNGDSLRHLLKHYNRLPPGYYADIRI